MTLFVSVAGRPQDPASAEEAAEALRDSETGIAPDLLAEVAEAIRGSALGVMLYGSQARGSADESSDVDVLQVVSRHAGAYKVGRVAVTAYTPAHLHQMASHGSLFVLHLRTEGVVLEDAHGVVARALEAYRSPIAYNPLLSELQAAAVRRSRGRRLSFSSTDRRWDVSGYTSSVYTSSVPDSMSKPRPPPHPCLMSTGPPQPPVTLVWLKSWHSAERASCRQVNYSECAKRCFADSTPPRRGLHFANLAVALARTHPHASALVAQVITAATCTRPGCPPPSPSTPARHWRPHPARSNGDPPSTSGLHRRHAIRARGRGHRDGPCGCRRLSNAAPPLSQDTADTRHGVQARA